MRAGILWAPERAAYHQLQHGERVLSPSDVMAAAHALDCDPVRAGILGPAIREVEYSGEPEPLTLPAPDQAPTQPASVPEPERELVPAR